MCVKITRAANRGDRFIKHALRCRVPIMTRSVPDGGIDLTIVKVDIDVSHIQINIKFRVLLSEPTETRCKPFSGKRNAGTDPQPSGRIRSPQTLGFPRDVTQNTGNRMVKISPFLRQDNLACQSDK